MSTDLVALVMKAKSLPALPASAIEVLRLTRDGEASAEQLAKVIEHDPTLTAKLLKLVNSALFGMCRKITTVQQAVALAGQRTVCITTLSVSVAEQISADRAEGFDYKAYWRSSLTAAVAARAIGQAVAPKIAEEAFAGGLLSQIGRLAAHRVAPERYAQAIKNKDRAGGRLRDAEREAFGVTGATLGRVLLERWGLPEPLCLAVGASQGEGIEKLEGPTRRLALLVHSACVVAELFCREVAAGEMERVRSVVTRCTGLSAEALDSTLADLRENVTVTARDMSIEIGALADYGDIRAQAAIELAQLSLLAEAERSESTTRAEEAEAQATRLFEEKKKIIEVATTDTLTRIPNRAAFEKRLDEEIVSARGAEGVVGLLLLDVDHFKIFNDTYGHQAGDEVLRAVAAALRDSAAGSAYTARWGGEEFVAVGRFRDAHEVVALGERVRGAIESARVHWDGAPLHVTASVGVAVAAPGREPVSCESMIAGADARMYEAKQAGRNRVVCAAA